MEYKELVVQYSEQREKIYKEILERLVEWISIRPRTIQGLLDLISYIDSSREGANLANIVGSGTGVLGSSAVLLGPFTGGLSLAIGGLVVSGVGVATSVLASAQDSSVAKENCEKAQELIDKDAKATDALTSSVKKYLELTQKLSDCLKSVHGKINSKTLTLTEGQAISRSLCFTLASISAFSKVAGKAGSKLIPVFGSIASIAVDVTSIVIATKDIKEGSKSEAGKELLKVVERLREQRRDLYKLVIQAIKIQSQDAPSKEDEKKIIEQLVKQSKKENQTKTDDSDSDESEDEKSINFCLMNARSVFNKWDKLTKYVAHKSIDVLAVTETWNRGKPLVTTVPGYDPFFYSPREERGGGGVGALIKSDILVYSIKRNFETFECMYCILIVISKKAVDIIRIYILYRPPKTNFKSFLGEFIQLIAESDSKSKVIIMGDFNINWGNSESSGIRDFFDGVGLCQHVNEVTHEGGGILDWVVTRNAEEHLIENLQVDRLTKKVINFNHFPFSILRLINLDDHPVEIQKSINLDHYPVTFTVKLRH